MQVTRNFFLWQIIICVARMSLPVTRKYFLHVVCDRKISFIRQKRWKYLEVKFEPKQRELLQKFRENLKISWEPGSLTPREYPSLPYTTNFLGREVARAPISGFFPLLACLSQSASKEVSIVTICIETV